MNISAAAPRQMSAPLFAFTSSQSRRHGLMQKAFREDAAAVAFTHAAPWFLGKQMGEMRTVYHDRLQMSFCGQCTLLWKWFGQWKREEKYNRDKKGKWESLSVCLSHSLSFSVHRWSVIDVMEIDFQVNYFAWLGLGETIISLRPPCQRGPCDSQAVLPPRRTALIAHFNILDSFCDSFTSGPPA